MRLLLDTHILIWATTTEGYDPRMSVEAADLIDDPGNQLHFSPIAVWECAIKTAKGRASFQIDPHVLRRGLLDNGYVEIPITAAHAAATQHLPPIHKDPFDRMLVAQATVEGVTLLTSDATVARYPGPVRRV